MDERFRKAGAKFDQKFDKLVERVFILQFEQNILKENGSKDKLLQKNYFTESSADSGAADVSTKIFKAFLAKYEPTYTFKGLAYFAKNSCERIRQLL